MSIYKVKFELEKVFVIGKATINVAIDNTPVCEFVIKMGGMVVIDVSEGPHILTVSMGVKKDERHICVRQNGTIHIKYNKTFGKPEIADIGPFDTDEEGTSSADNMYVSLDNIDPDYIKSSFGDRKVEAIRYVREQTGISLKEAKEYVDKIYTRECVKGETANGTNEDFYKAIRSLPGADVFGTRKEIRHLQEIMLDGEVVNAVSSGIMNNHTWLMASTNKRVLLVNKNFLVGMQQMEIPLNQINAISYTMGIVFSTITISHGGASMRIENVQKGSEKYFVEATNKAIREYGVNINVINPQPVTPAFSSADEIRKFKELLDMGAITQEEFEAKKKQLLGL